MYTVVIHDSETEEIMGSVTQADGCSMDFDKFYDTVRKSWAKFNDEGLTDDYSIEDFVEWHNDNNELQIDWVLSEFIQL
jgi:hypothetical protein